MSTENITPENWYTEIYPNDGAALSLEIRNKIHDEQTPYQRLEIYETTHFGRLMTLDGLVMLTDRDNFIYHEMMTHPALYTHPNPRRVAIIGGGDCGCLKEVLKHEGVESATQIELDERVTRVSEEFFPELCTANTDTRARLEFVDGIKWIAEAETGSLDVIIVDSTDPVGPAAGLFSADFYTDCHRVLGENGILVVQSESPLLHLSLMENIRAAMDEAGFDHMTRLLFPQYTYPSGWWSASLASKNISPVNFRFEDSARKGFKTRYYNAAIHAAAMALPEFMCE